MILLLTYATSYVKIGLAYPIIGIINYFSQDGDECQVSFY